MESEGLACRLHTYSRAKRLVAVESGDIGNRNALLFIGGLGDGLNATPFIEPLSAQFDEGGWALVQILTCAHAYERCSWLSSSSGSGWGTGSVGRDAEEIAECVRYLRGLGRRRIVLLGHSTGQLH